MELENAWGAMKSPKPAIWTTLLDIFLPDSALDNFTTMTVHRSSKFQNMTKSISAQCAIVVVVKASAKGQ